MNDLWFKLFNSSDVACDTNDLTVAWIKPIAPGGLSTDCGYAVVVEGEFTQVFRGLHPDHRYFVHKENRFS